MERISSHTGLGLVLGAALGVVAGMVLGHVGVWLALGVAIGMLLGASFRRGEAACPQCAAVHKMHHAELRTENREPRTEN